MKKTADPTKTPAKHSGWKAARAARRKAYYASRPYATDAAKKRTLARQLRYFPENRQAVSQYVQKYGQGAADAQLAKLAGKARKRELIAFMRIAKTLGQSRKVTHGN